MKVNLNFSLQSIKLLNPQFPLLRNFFILILTALIFSVVYAQDNQFVNTTLVKSPFGHVPITKATKPHLFLYMGNRVKFDNPQGLAVTRLKSWEDSTKTGDDAIVTVYGINSGQNLIIYNTSLFTIDLYGPQAEGEKKLNAPRGIAADTDGNVYVADTGNGRIVHLFNTGKKLDYVGEIGKEYLAEPKQIALDAEGNVFATDAAVNKVMKFSPEDRLLLSFDNNGALDSPDGLIVFDGRENWRGYGDRYYVVIDKENKRISKFSSEWGQVKQIEGEEFGFPDCFLAYGAGDYYGNSFVTDMKNHTIHKFDKDLNYITSFGSEGTDEGEFIEPRGICIWQRFGQVIVAEKEGAQYFWIGTDVLDMKAGIDSEKQFLSVAYFLTEESMVTFKIKDLENNKEVDIFGTPIRRKIGGNSERIRLERIRGRSGMNLAGPGSFELIIEASATYSSGNYFTRTKSVKVEF